MNDSVLLGIIFGVAMGAVVVALHEFIGARRWQRRALMYEQWWRSASNRLIALGDALLDEHHAAEMFRGDISDVRVFDYALTASEVSELYEAPHA